MEKATAVYRKINLLKDKAGKGGEQLHCLRGRVSAILCSDGTGHLLESFSKTRRSATVITNNHEVEVNAMNAIVKSERVIVTMSSRLFLKNLRQSRSAIVAGGTDAR